jgi:hypothetical protein
MPEAGELFNYIFPSLLAEGFIGGFCKWLEGAFFALLRDCRDGRVGAGQWLVDSATMAARL